MKHTLWIDCEFNEFKGELISMALVDASGLEFYEVLPCENPGNWVKQHVMPILGKKPITKEEFQDKLQDFLMQFPEIHVVADWPEDLSHFCNALITGPGKRLNTPPLSMEIIRVNASSDLPHNALADAIGIRNHLLEQARREA
jgi:hypothetical protein